MAALAPLSRAIPLLGGAPARSSLLTGLVSYWALDEPSGNAIDAHGTNHLADVNTVTSGAGKPGTGRQFTAANSEYFTIPSNPSLNPGTSSFTFALWLNLDTITTVQDVLCKYVDFSQHSYLLQFHSAAGGVLIWGVSANGSVDIGGSNPLVLVAGTWYFVVCWYDAAAGTVNIQINNGTPASYPHSGGVFASTAPFLVSSRQSGTIEFVNGRLDEIGFWLRTLTAAERSALYNAGAGRTYPFVGAS